MSKKWFKKEGGTKKIRDAEKPCFAQDHNPPSHRVFSPGEYEHTCSACGKITRFRVPLIIC